MKNLPFTHPHVSFLWDFHLHSSFALMNRAQYDQERALIKK